MAKRAAKKAKPAVKPKTRIFWPYGIAIFAVLLFIDQYTKHIIATTLVVNQSVKIMPGVWYTYIYNTGALWSIFQDSNALFIWLSVIAFGLLLFFYDAFTTTVEKVAYAMLLAGLWGNMLDRVLWAHVIDFIDLRWWPVFNIADSCISIAIVLFLLEQWRKSRKSRAKSA